MIGQGPALLKAPSAASNAFGLWFGSTVERWGIQMAAWIAVRAFAISPFMRRSKSRLRPQSPTQGQKNDCAVKMSCINS